MHTEIESGFYRVDSNDFQHAPNFVYAPDYTLLREERESYSYPTQGGWRWFETTAAARTFFGIPEPDVN